MTASFITINAFKELEVHNSAFNHNLGFMKPPRKQGLLTKTQVMSVPSIVPSDIITTHRSVVDSPYTSISSSPTPHPQTIEKITFSQFKDAVRSYNGNNHRAPPEPSEYLFDQYLGHLKKYEMGLVEQAMFLANLIWESFGFSLVEEIACKSGNCEYGNYFGRGFIQLTWEKNYRDASWSLYGDDRLVIRPELVSETPTAWETAFWYWEKIVRPVMGRYKEQLYFGHTILAINGYLECGPTRKSGNAIERLRIFENILEQWKVTEYKNDFNLMGCLDIQDVEEALRTTIVPEKLDNGLKTTTPFDLDASDNTLNSLDNSNSIVWVEVSE